MAKDNLTIRVSEAGRAAAQEVADERFEGNLGAAIRYLLGLGLNAHRGAESTGLVRTG